MIHPELPIGAFMAAILCLIPLPWHWRARNVSTISLIVWLFVSNIIYGVDAIIWRDNAMVLVPVWCDISTKLLVGATIALPACCLCICIQLERIASPRSSSMSATDRTRRRIFDTFMCWGVPIIYMALHYVVQGHRFDIIEVIGCRANLYVSVASIFLQTIPPLLITSLTFVYAGLALLHFFRRRMTFSTHLSNSSSGLTPSRYFRLMIMAVVEMTMGLTLTILDTWSNYQWGTRPWISWADVHSNFGRVGQFPWIMVPKAGRAWDLGMWWTIPLSSVIFFAFFGFGEDAVKEYIKCWEWVCRVVLRQGEKGSLGMAEIGSSTGSLTKFPSSNFRSFSDVASQKTESTVFSPTSVDKFNPLPSYKQSQSMLNKPSFASLLEKPLPVLDIRADPIQTLPASPTMLTLSQELDIDRYSLYAETVTPTVADTEEVHDEHAGTAHTPHIV